MCTRTSAEYEEGLGRAEESLEEENERQRQILVVVFKKQDEAHKAGLFNYSSHNNFRRADQLRLGLRPNKNLSVSFPGFEDTLESINKVLRNRLVDECQTM